jgi:hypothetical protein
LIPTEAAKVALGKAVDALKLLDGNNHLVERCRYYLQQLVSILKSNSKFPIKLSFWSHYVATLTFDSVARPGHTIMPAENQIYANTQQQLDVTNFDFVADPGWSMQPAFDINLGEFMLDSEMQFLNNYFRKDGLGNTSPTLGPG